MSIRPCDESIFHRPTFGWFVVTFFSTFTDQLQLLEKIMPKIHFNNYDFKKKRCLSEWCEWGIAFTTKIVSYESRPNNSLFHMKVV